MAGGGICHQRLKMHFPGVSFIRRSNCIGWRLHRFTENIVGRARGVVAHPVQIAFMSMVKGGAACYNAVPGCRAREG